jgi:hypothetical protein
MGTVDNERPIGRILSQFVVSVTSGVEATRWAFLTVAIHADNWKFGFFQIFVDCDVKNWIIARCIGSNSSETRRHGEMRLAINPNHIFHRIQSRTFSIIFGIRPETIRDNGVLSGHQCTFPHYLDATG